MVGRLLFRVMSCPHARVGPTQVQDGYGCICHKGMALRSFRALTAWTGVDMRAGMRCPLLVVRRLGETHPHCTLH